MEVKYQVCSLNFLRKKKKNSHGHVILLGSINYLSNVVSKASLTTH